MRRSEGLALRLAVVQTRRARSRLPWRHLTSCLAPVQRAQVHDRAGHTVSHRAGLGGTARRRQLGVLLGEGSRVLLPASPAQLQHLPLEGLLPCGVKPIHTPQVLEAMQARAEAIAFTDFPADDSQLMLTLKQLASSRMPCVGVGISPPLRRHSHSPRMGSGGLSVRMRGVDKASGGAVRQPLLRTKRSAMGGDDFGSLHKKVRVGSGGSVFQFSAALPPTDSPMQLSP